MATGYRIQPDALEAYATTLEAAADQVSQIMSTIGSVQVSGDSFGLLPDAQRLHGGYQEHAEADVQDCSDLDGALRGIAEGLRSSAESYRNADEGTIVTMGAVQA